MAALSAAFPPPITRMSRSARPASGTAGSRSEESQGHLNAVTPRSEGMVGWESALVPILMIQQALSHMLAISVRVVAFGIAALHEAKREGFGAFAWQSLRRCREIGPVPVKSGKRDQLWRAFADRTAHDGRFPGDADPA